VDDDASVGRAVARFVRQLGMDAETFVSGRDLLDRVERTPAFAPDCVLLDMQMPGLSGHDVQVQLARLRPCCPVVIMTAYSDADGHERALALGAVGVLFKPLDEHLFVMTLQTALGRVPRRAEEAGRGGPAAPRET
jgi:FixJ family two-component response regulator